MLVGYNSIYITGKGSTRLKFSRTTCANCVLFLSALVCLCVTVQVRSEAPLQLMNRILASCLGKCSAHC